MGLHSYSTVFLVSLFLLDPLLGHPKGQKNPNSFPLLEVPYILITKKERNNKAELQKLCYNPAGVAQRWSTEPPTHAQGFSWIPSAGHTGGRQPMMILSLMFLSIFFSSSLYISKILIFFKLIICFAHIHTNTIKLKYAFPI